jgi:uncharacterized membrane protein YphA (DoxX/SURF4 family)
MGENSLGGLRSMRTVESFADDLRTRYEGCLWRGRANYCAAYLFLVVAVCSSAVATVSVALDLWPRTVNAVLAAVPGAMYLVNRQFRFEQRSKWWFEKFYVIEALYRGIVRENRDEAEISKELTLQSKALAGRWPGFGEPPKTK